MTTKFILKHLLVFAFVLFTNLLFGQTNPAPTNLTVTNNTCGQIGLAWSDYGNGINESSYTIYRSTLPNGYYSYIGSVNANVLSFNDENYELAPNNTYYYKIEGQINNSPSQKSEAVAVNYTCAGPTGLAITNTNCGAVTLNWNNFPSGILYNGFEVLRRVGDGNGNFNTAGYTQPGVTTFVDNYFSGSMSEVFYIVKGRFNNSTSSNSNQVSTFITCPTVSNPTFQSSSCGKITIAWSDFTGNFSETGFEIFRSLYGEEGTYNSIGQVGANILTFTDNGYIESGKKYFYKIRGVFNSSYTELSDFTTGSMTCTNPTNLSISNNNCGGITLNWDDYPAGINESGYLVSVKTSSGFSNGYYIGANVLNFTDNFASLLVDDQITYEVKGRFENTITGSSNKVTTQINCNLSTSLSVVSISNEKISLAWDAITIPNLNITGYEIWRANGINGNYINIRNFDQNTLSFDDNQNLTGGETYFYKIRVKSNNITGGFSSPVSATINNEGPVGLTLTEASCGNIKINWQDISDFNESGFRIFRSTSENGSYQIIGSTITNVLTFSDIDNLQPNTIYYYKIQAQNYNFNKITKFSNVILASFTCAKPNNLAVANIECGKVNITWDPIPNPAQNSKIEIFKYSPNNSNEFQNIGQVNATATSYSDISYFVKDVEYIYQIRYANGYNSNSYFSNQVTAPMSCPQNNSTVTIDNVSCGNINISWPPTNGSNITGYKIYRNTIGQNYFQILKTVAANILTYSDNYYLESNKQYNYIIAPIYNSTDGNLSSESALATHTCLAPGNLRSTTPNCYSVKLDWDSPSNNVSFYNIYRTNNSAPSSYIGQVSGNTTTYTDFVGNSALNVSYTYKVSANISGGITDFSNTVTNQFTCLSPSFSYPIPTGLTASANNCGKITLTWNDVPATFSETGFTILRSITGGNDFNYYSSVSANVFTFNDLNVIGGQTYYYKIGANLPNNYVDYNLNFSAPLAVENNCVGPKNFITTQANCAGLSFTWDNSPNAISYDIQVSETGSNSSYTFFADNVTTNKYVVDSPFFLKTNKEYYFKIRARVSDSNNYGYTFSSYSNLVLVNLNCDQPNNLSIVASDCNGVKLSWTKATNPNVISYIIYKADTENGNYNSIGAVQRLENTFTDVGMSKGLESGKTYYYKVAAFYTNSTSESSNIVTNTYYCAKPTNLVEVGSCGAIALTWNDYPAGTYETGYKIYRSSTSTGPFNKIGDISANNLGFIDKSEGLAPNQNYYYKIRANFKNPYSYDNDYGILSEFSDIISANYTCSQSSILTLVSANCEGVKLSWTDSTPTIEETGYNIYKSKDINLSYPILVGSVYNNTYTFADNYNFNLESGVNFYYFVQGIFGKALLAKSNVITANINCAGPTKLSFTGNKCGQISITWDAVQNLPFGPSYQIYRSENGINGNYTFYSNSQTNYFNDNSNYNNNNIIDGKEYFYKVKTQYYYNLYSDFSAPIAGSTSCSAPALSLSTISCGNIKITWDNYSDGTDESGYEIYRSSTGEFGQYNLVKYVGKDVLSITDNSLVLGTTYFYKIKGKFGNVLTSFSNAVSGVSNCPNPTNLKIISTSCGEIKLAWDDMPSNIKETSYKIYRSEYANSQFIFIGNVGANTLTFTNNNQINGGTKYFYKIVAIIGNTETDFSNTISGQTSCGTISNLTIISSNCSSISLYWDSKPGVQNYQIFRSTDEFGIYNQINNSQINSYTDIYIANEKEYFYKVRYNLPTTPNNYYNSPLSDFSNVVSAKVQCPNITNLKVTSTECGIINLAWDAIPPTANSSGPTSYNIIRGVEYSNGYIWNYEVATVPASQLYFSDIGNGYNNQGFSFMAGQNYIYTVRAVYNNTLAGISNTVMGSFICDKVTDLSISSSDCQKTSLSWTSVANASSYDLYKQSFSGSEYYFVANINANTTNYDDNYSGDRLNSGEVNKYKIVAKFGTTNFYYSDYSNIVNTTLTCGAAPTSVTINMDECGKIKLSWSDYPAGTDETGYIIYRSTSTGGPYLIFNQLSANVLNYTEQFSLVDGTTYYYRVAGIFGNTITPKSTEVSGAFICYTVPSLSLASADCNGIKLTWTDVPSSQIPYEYVIYRKETGSNLPEISIGSVNNFNRMPGGTFTDIGQQNMNIKAGTSYEYRVAGYYGNYSQKSNVVVANFSCSINANLTATVLNCNQIKLNWEESPMKDNYNFKYNIYKSENGINGDYKYLNSTLINFFTDKNTKPNITNYYKIDINNGNVRSEFSNYATMGPLVSSMTTLRSGDWNDPTVWSCGRVPDIFDEITVNSSHNISIGDNFNAKVKNIINNGNLIFGLNAYLILNP